MNAFEAEKVHSKMYEKAKKTIDEGKDTSFNNIYVCEVCGYTIEDTVPDRCPVCNAPREKFRKF
jgi:rubrerythrin